MSAPDDQVVVITAGQRLAVRGGSARARRALHLATGGVGDFVRDDSTDSPDVQVRLASGAPEVHPRDEDAFLVTRGVHALPDGAAVVASSGGSGHAQRWQCLGRPGARRTLLVHDRWSPTALERAAAAGFTARHRALRSQVLLHYPALWWAVVHGLAPIHASVVEVDGVVVLLAGPGGVGKSTLVAGEIAAGGRAMCDNLAVTDGLMTFGVAEPLRVSGRPTGPDRRTAPRAAHGRREHPWGPRPTALVPDLVVSLRRGNGVGHVRDTDSEAAARVLVAGTFGAGELRRFWPLCASLALATSVGPAVPDVEGRARKLTERVPCVELRLPPRPGTSLRTLLAGPLDEVRRGRTTGSSDDPRRETAR